ncbi:MAG TPA: STAS domain-containing protein [Humibacillus xanthopallidus]|nr:STAS domain-containing protein [Humibacillus xanthopallidus]
MSELARLESRRVGETQHVSVIGEVDLSNARALLDAVAAAVPDDAARVVLDLSSTTYLDSAGIAAVFRLAERLRIRRQDLRLVVPPGSPIRPVLRLTHLDHVIPVDDTPPGAVPPDAPGPA